MLLEPKRPTAVDAHRLERGPTPREPLVVGREDGLGGLDETAPRNSDRTQRGSAQRAAAARGAAGRLHPAPGRPAARRSHEQWIGLDPRFVDLGLRIRVPDDAAADPEMDPPSAIANVRIVSASSRSPLPCTRPRAPIEALGRPARARRSLDRGDLRRAGDRPARERCAEQFGEPDAGTQRALDGRHHVLDACEGPVAISSGQRTLPGTHTRDRSFRSRSTIITCSAASFTEPASSLQLRRACALDRHRPDPIAVASDEQLRRARDDRPVVAPVAALGWVGSASGRRARPGAGEGAERCWTRLTW